MRQLSVGLLIAVLLPVFSQAGRAGESPEPSPYAQTARRDIADFVTPEGHIDLAALRASGYEGPLEFDGMDIQIDPLTGEPVVQPSAATEPDPDDVYWDNGISHCIPGILGTVNALAVYDGKLIIGGDFSVAGCTLANNIAAWDGTSLSPLGTGLGGGLYSSTVYALTVYDSKLIVGGGFLTAGGVEANRIASWDGSSWAPLGPGVNNIVTALGVYDGKLIASGYFSKAGAADASHIASWDGISWSPMGEGVNNLVYTFSIYDNKLIAGGAFTKAGGMEANHIVSWDGTSWSLLGAGMNDYVYALAIYDNRLIAGGYFSKAGAVNANHIASWDGTTWSALGAGSDSAMVSLGGLIVYDNTLIAAGNFITTGGLAATYVASWDGATWLPMGAEFNDWVYELAVYDDELMAGGIFTIAGGADATRIAAWDGAIWRPLSEGSGLDGSVYTLSVHGDNLIAGGTFSLAGGGSVGHIASWDGTSWAPLGSGLQVFATALCNFDDKLIVGDGYLTGLYASSIVRAWDGLTWTSLGTTKFGSVKSIIVYDHELIVDRVTIGGIECFGATSYLGQWNGSDWQELNVLDNEETSNSVIFDDKLYIGGATSCFTFYEELSGILVSWDGNSWATINTNPIYALTVYRNKLYAIINPGVPEAYSYGTYILAVWDGQSWSSLGEIFNGRVNVLGDYDNKLIAAGNFTTIGSDDANHIASWNGESWSPLGSGTNDPVSTMTVYNGSLVVGGSFTAAGGKVAPNIAIWTKHDLMEVILDLRPGSCVNPINGNSAHGQGKAVLPVAIMGTADFDVHDIDLATLTLNGSSPVRWDYRDVGAPPDDPDEECPCSKAGPDGYIDLNLKFYGAEIVASLNGSNIVSVEGQLNDGSSFEGQDCVTLVGHSAMREAASDTQERGFEVIGNYPNPFNPSTKISFYLPDAADVKLEIFNILGQRVSTLIDRTLEAGEHSAIWDGSNAASGVYYYRLTMGEQVATKRMLLLK